MPIDGDLLNRLMLSGEAYGLVFTAKVCDGAVESLRLLFHVSYQAML